MPENELPTVAMLIELLKKLPQDKKVVYPVKSEDGHWLLHPVNNVEDVMDKRIIFTRTKAQMELVVVLS